MAPPSGKKTRPLRQPPRCTTTRTAVRGRGAFEAPSRAHAHLAPVTCSLSRPNPSGTDAPSETTVARALRLPRRAAPRESQALRPSPTTHLSAAGPRMFARLASWPRPPCAQVQTRLGAWALGGRPPAAFRTLGPSSFLARASLSVSLLKRAT